MRRYILCAAIDYKHLRSSEFMNYCSRRVADLISNAPRGEDLQLDIYEFKSGKVHSTTVRWVSGKAMQTTAVAQRFDPITEADFETRPLMGNQVDEHAFKAGRPKVMSIRDVYDAVVRTGAEFPNTLHEFSIFSHAYDDGPILVNSYDDRDVALPARFGVVAEGYRRLQGTERNPDDKDGRAQYDFVAPTLPPKSREAFRAAFSPQGHIWVWGCNHDFKTNSLLSVVRRAIAGKGSLADDLILKFQNLTAEQLQGFLEFNHAFKLDRDQLLKTRACVLKFGQIREALWARITASYACQAAEHTQVRCIGAIYGTYAEPDKGRQPALMSVSADTSANVVFYRSYFGLTTDPEGRNYGVYTHGMKMKP